jgi:hypothetical protein
VVNTIPRLLFLQQRTPVPTELKSGWVSELAWMFRRTVSSRCFGIEVVLYNKQ